MLVGTPTIDSVSKELAEMQASFKVRQRTLKALLSALKAEAGVVEPTPEPPETGKGKKGATDGG